MSENIQFQFRFAQIIGGLKGLRTCAKFLAPEMVEVIQGLIDETESLEQDLFEPAPDGE